MCNSRFEPSSCDWGMGDYYRQMEIYDAETDAREAYQQTMQEYFDKYRDNIMPQIYLQAYEYRNEALQCVQDDYLGNNDEWMSSLAECMEDMDFGLTGWQDEEAREALMYMIENHDSYLHCSRINEFVKAYKGL